MKNRLLAIKQLDKQLNQIEQITIPKQGWIRTIRNAINMTLPQLAKRLGVTRSRVIRIEQDEPQGKLTLNTLKKVANSLSCKLVYVFIPKDVSFEAMLQKQAHKIAEEQVLRTNHTMGLEGQSISKTAQKEQIEHLTKQLLENAWKHLWKNK